MNDDSYFEQFHKDPPQAFGEDLYARLQALDDVGDGEEQSESKEITTMTWFNGFPVSLVAGLMATLFSVLLLINGVSDGNNTVSLSQIEDIALSDLQRITPENAEDLQLLRTLGRGQIWDTAWSPRGDAIAFATTTGMYLHSPADLSDLRILLGTEGRFVSALDYSPDGSMIVAYVEDELLLWMTDTGELVRRIQREDFFWRRWVDFTTDGERLIARDCLDDDARPVSCETIIFTIYDLDGNLLTERSYTSDSNPEISPDGRFIAQMLSENQVRLLDVATGDTLHLLDTGTTPVHQMFFSPDGTYLALSNNSVQIRVYPVSDLLQGDTVEIALSEVDPLLSQFLPETYTFNRVYTVAFNTDGSQLAVTDYEGYVHIFDVENNVLLETLSVSGVLPASMLFSPDGETLMTINGSAVASIWDLNDTESTPEPIFLPYTNGYGNYDLLEFDAERRYLVTSTTGLWNMPTQLWDLTVSEPQVQTLLPPDENILTGGTTSANINADGSQVVLHVTRNNSLNATDTVLYDTSDGTYTYLNDITTSSSRPQPQFTADDDLLLLSRQTSNLELLRWQDPENFEALRLQQRDESDDANTRNLFFTLVTTISADGSLVAAPVCVEAYSEYDAACDAEIRIWDANTGALLLALDDSAFETTRYEGFSTLEFSADNRYLAAGSCFEYDEETSGQIIRCLESGVRVWDVSAALDLLGTDDVPEIATLEPMTRLDSTITPYPMPHVAFAPVEDGEPLMLAFNDNIRTMIYAIDALSGEATRLHQIPTVGYPTFSADGELLAVSRFGTVRLYGLQQE